MITVRNTNTAPYSVYDYIMAHGIYGSSRNGPVVSVPYPVTIQYTHPLEMVNFCQIRDANPFFHFFERLWFIEGVGDVELIQYFLPRMADYADPGHSLFNAHYGRNIRRLFGRDQLAAVINELREDPHTRQAVVQIWNPADLGKETRDKACNMQLVFRTHKQRLDMTVFNRSNDAIWGGVTGANITNLPVFLEYVAERTGYTIGSLYIVSNNLHLYTENPKYTSLMDTYAGKLPALVHAMNDLDLYTVGDVEATHYQLDDGDINTMLDLIREYPPLALTHEYSSSYIENVAKPMLGALISHRARKDPTPYVNQIQASDWRLGVHLWLTRRGN